LEHNSTNVLMLCYYCRHSNKAHKDLSDPLIERSECLSPELFANQSQFQRQCAPNEGFCMTSVSSMNGFFVEMRRDCAERCRAGCQRGRLRTFQATMSLNGHQIKCRWGRI
uniref:BPTI/Kunitz inhibitor domain-containing protein n=1 Tax=Globodera pallida TaxID=36090 RepID=A0A183CSA0_GLOPA